MKAIDFTKLSPFEGSKQEEIAVHANDFAQLQRTQHVHDMRNHFDIVSLHKTERMKHYGLHYAKYVGRLARGSSEPKPVQRTLVDALLVNLSAANTLAQDLSRENLLAPTGRDLFLIFADASGRFADACEKIDHMEDFVSIARQANKDIACWVLAMTETLSVDLLKEVSVRRRELSERHFYIAD
ncbi:hypothetical protein GGE68_004403 [Rhizobium leguminosarum]|uniref:hypothetical protein n=1 Tax=Rhizobium leguminosarum TaxID=384 RepID=UPI00161B2B81|nr:hypothetical protein [Rhizobium leguminosarum]MBB5666173.1 hypothetical protein [Rhizobium leguminosarum]